MYTLKIEVKSLEHNVPPRALIPNFFSLTMHCHGLKSRIVSESIRLQSVCLSLSNKLGRVQIGDCGYNYGFGARVCYSSTLTDALILP